MQFERASLSPAQPAPSVTARPDACPSPVLPPSQAIKLAPLGSGQWFYCSGFYKAATGEFTMYSELEGEQRQGGRSSKREAHAFGVNTAAADEQRGGSRGDAKRLKADAKAGAVGEGQRSGGDASGEEQQRAPKPAGMPGKQCVECGATATPQWREGPHGEWAKGRGTSAAVVT